jgi:hypothetical protein
MRNRRFEAWFARRNDLPPETVAAMWDAEKRTYTDYKYHVEFAWEAWCTALGFEAET